MVFDTECMLSDPVAMTDRCEKEKEESVRQRHLHVDRRFAKIEDRDDLRAAGKIQDLLPHITEAEALIALDLCNNDEKVTAKKLQSYDFLLQIRRKVCQKIRPLNEPCDQKLRSPTADRNSCKAAASNREGNVDVDMSGWSEARKLAWARKDEMPNSYAYCYPEPTEEQVHGRWTAEEHDLFMREAAAAGGWEVLRADNMQWGLFSQKIPGRVGYQCSNYFLFLERRKRAYGGR